MEIERIPRHINMIREMPETDQQQLVYKYRKLQALQDRYDILLYYYENDKRLIIKKAISDLEDIKANLTKKIDTASSIVPYKDYFEAVENPMDLLNKLYN